MHATQSAWGGHLDMLSMYLGAVVLETALGRRGETSRVFRHGVVAVAAMLVAFTIWLLSNAGWCDPDSLPPGHAAWHLLCAVAAYWLYPLHASELRAT